MKTVIVLKGVQLVVEYDYSPADNSVGWGEEAEVTSVHVANGPDSEEFDILMLIGWDDMRYLETACVKAAKADANDNFIIPDYLEAALDTTPDYLVSGTGARTIEGAAVDEQTMLDAFRKLDEPKRFALIAAAQAMNISK